MRSASLISTTRMSSTIASSILRRFSACAARCCAVAAGIGDGACIDVHPRDAVDSVATSAPNSAAITRRSS